MKKKFFTLMIIFLVLTSKLIGQNLQGIWLSSFTLETTKKHIPYKPDSIFIKANLLLDFIDDENVIFKPLGHEKETGKFSVSNNKIKIKIGNDSLKGEFLKNELILTLIDTVEYISKIYFKKITPSELTPSQLPNSSSFFNSSWIIKPEVNFEYYGAKFNFLNKDSLDSFNRNIVLITKNEGLYGFTEKGSYKIDFYKNHFFIGIFNTSINEETVYHFYKFEKNEFFADTYQNFYSYSKSLPKLNKIKFIKTDYLTTEQINLLRSKLIGKWKAINNPIPFKTIGSKFKKLENQSFNFVFKENNEFELIKKGMLVNGDLTVPKTVIVNGKWKISKTGNYILLKPNDSWVKYITIKELSNDNLKIFYDVETLEENTHYSNRMLIELIK